MHGGAASLPPREGTRPTAWAKALAAPGGLTDPHTHGRLEDEPCFVPPFQGLDRLWAGQPGALPRAGVCRAVGAPGSCPTRRFGFTGGSPWPTPIMARRLSRNDAVGREALTPRKRGRAVSALAGLPSGRMPLPRCRRRGEAWHCGRRAGASGGQHGWGVRLGRGFWDQSVPASGRRRTRRPEVSGTPSKVRRPPMLRTPA